MQCRAVYTVRVLTPTERRLVRDHWEDYKKRTKSRILIQQLEDGLPTFRHYGIDLGDGTDYDGFAQGGQICYADDVRLAFSQDRIMDRALSQVGSDFGGYHFLCNNCEHFANWCACGKRISRQVLMR